MDWEYFKNYLLSSIPYSKQTSGGKAINCRCFECGDSPNIKSAHLYILMPREEGMPSIYYCHKCNSVGVVDHTTLIKWGIYNSDIALELSSYNKSISGSNKAKQYFNTSTYQIRHSYITMNDNTERKRQYVCNRIGYNFSYQELADLKICLNLIDLLEENNISRLTRGKNIVKELDEQFIGFISIDNAFLNMRRTCREGLVTPEIDKRYINYRIFDKMVTNDRFYTIPCNINLNSTERIKLYIAEGPFDILSIYTNLRNKEPGIYTAAAGNNYANIIIDFLITKQLPYIELHLAVDNDKFGTIEKIQRDLNRIPDKTFPVYIHRNNYPGEKDFGVPLNRIQESIMQIR